MKAHELITDKELTDVFSGTNFGDCTPRYVVDKSLREIRDGYATGSTAQTCLIELGLVRLNKKRCCVITELGLKYLQFKEKEDKNKKMSLTYSQNDENKLFNKIKNSYLNNEHLDNTSKSKFNIYEVLNDCYGDFNGIEYMVYINSGISFSIFGELNLSSLDLVATFTQHWGDEKSINEIIEMLK